MPNPQDNIAVEFVSASLLEAVERWHEGGDHSLASWRAMMRTALSGPLERDLDEYSYQIEARGIEPLSVEQRKMLVLWALRNTEDIRETLVSAPSVTTLTASPWFVERLLTAAHQSRIVKNLIRFLRGRLVEESVSSDPRWTGARRWLTDGRASSRHRTQDRQVRREGEMFTLSDGSQVFGPRDDIMNNDESSGCLCSLQYLYQYPDGTQTWI